MLGIRGQVGPDNLAFRVDLNNLAGSFDRNQRRPSSRAAAIPHPPVGEIGVLNRRCVVAARQPHRAPERTSSRRQWTASYKLFLARIHAEIQPLQSSGAKK